jgi:hypothetical protein
MKSSRLPLVRETVRDLATEELEKANGGRIIGPSELPTCLCSSIPCGGLVNAQKGSVQ